jgi:hypothetical protein
MQKLYSSGRYRKEWKGHNRALKVEPGSISHPFLKSKPKGLDCQSERRCSAKLVFPFCIYLCCFISVSIFWRLWDTQFSETYRRRLSLPRLSGQNNIFINNRIAFEDCPASDSSTPRWSITRSLLKIAKSRTAHSSFCTESQCTPQLPYDAIDPSPLLEYRLSQACPTPYVCASSMFLSCYSCEE